MFGNRPMKVFEMEAAAEPEVVYEVRLRFEQFLQTKPDPAVASSVREVLADWKREGRLK